MKLWVYGRKSYEPGLLGMLLKLNYGFIKLILGWSKEPLI